MTDSRPGAGRFFRRRDFLSSAAICAILAIAAIGAPAQGVVEANGTRVLHDDARRGFALTVLVESPRAEERVLAALGLSTPAEKTVVVVANQKELDRRVREATGSGAPDWAGAIAAPAARTVWIRVDLPRNEDLAVRSLLAHEYAHLAIHEGRLKRGTPAGPPRRWTEEGFAQIAAGRLRVDDRPDLRPAAWFGTLYGIAELDAAFRGGEGAAAKAYAQSEAFLRYLEDRHGRSTTPRLLRATLDGAEIDAAVFATCDRTIDDAWEAWTRELKRDRSWMAEIAGKIAVAIFICGAALLGFARHREKRRKAFERWDGEEAAMRERAAAAAREVDRPPDVD